MKKEKRKMNNVRAMFENKLSLQQAKIANRYFFSFFIIHFSFVWVVALETSLRLRLKLRCGFPLAPLIRVIEAMTYNCFFLENRRIRNMLFR